MAKSFKLVILFSLCALFWFAAYPKIFGGLGLRPGDTQYFMDAAQEGDIQKMATLHKTITFWKNDVGPCPPYPPGLVGPLLVEFNVIQTLEDVKNEVGPLEIGGRYRPADCVSIHKVAIIVPFRNRHQHLKHWLFHLHPILKRQQLDYAIYVINQHGDKMFNRAKLLNAGYVEALKEYNYNCFVFSDVNLVPLDDRNIYKCYDQPRHLSVVVDKFNFAQSQKEAFGGVLSMSKQQFQKVNGFPNTFWGHGGEDNDMFNRIVFRQMSISQPDSLTGRFKTLAWKRGLHDEVNLQNFDRVGHTWWTMDQDGLNTLKYEVLEIRKDQLSTFITVDINAE